MARVLGYGGLANTSGARDFSGKVEADEEIVFGYNALTVGLHVGMSVALLLYAKWIIPVITP